VKPPGHHRFESSDGVPVDDQVGMVDIDDRLGDSS